MKSRRMSTIHFYVTCSMSTNNHGGKREGAGRKASGKLRGTHTLTLSPEAAEKLKSVGRDKSEYIDRLILQDLEVIMNDSFTNDSFQLWRNDPYMQVVYDARRYFPDSTIGFVQKIITPITLGLDVFRRPVKCEPNDILIVGSPTTNIPASIANRRVAEPFEPLVFVDTKTIGCKYGKYTKTDEGVIITNDAMPDEIKNEDIYTIFPVIGVVRNLSQWREGSIEDAECKCKDTEAIQVWLKPSTIARIIAEAEEQGCTLGEVVEQYIK